MPLVLPAKKKPFGPEIHWTKMSTFLKRAFEPELGELNRWANWKSRNLRDSVSVKGLGKGFKKADILLSECVFGFIFLLNKPFVVLKDLNPTSLDTETANDHLIAAGRLILSSIHTMKTCCSCCLQYPAHGIPVVLTPVVKQGEREGFPELEGLNNKNHLDLVFITTRMIASEVVFTRFRL